MKHTLNSNSNRNTVETNMETMTILITEPQREHLKAKLRGWTELSLQEKRNLLYYESVHGCKYHPQHLDELYEALMSSEKGCFTFPMRLWSLLWEGVASLSEFFYNYREPHNVDFKSVRNLMKKLEERESDVFTYLKG